MALLPDRPEPIDVRMVQPERRVIDCHGRERHVTAVGEVTRRTADPDVDAIVKQVLEPLAPGRLRLPERQRLGILDDGLRVICADGQPVRHGPPRRQLSGIRDAAAALEPNDVVLPDIDAPRARIRERPAVRRDFKGSRRGSAEATHEADGERPARRTGGVIDRPVPVWDSHVRYARYVPKVELELPQELTVPRAEGRPAVTAAADLGMHPHVVVVTVGRAAARRDRRRRGGNQRGCLLEVEDRSDERGPLALGNVRQVADTAAALHGSLLSPAGRYAEPRAPQPVSPDEQPVWARVGVIPRPSRCPTASENRSRSWAALDSSRPVLV